MMSPMTVYVGNRYCTLQIRGLDDQEHDTVEALLIGRAGIVADT